MSTRRNNSQAAAVDERQPLLAEQRDTPHDATDGIDSSTAERQDGAVNGSADAGEESDVPSTEEPNKKKLLLIMMSMWVGVMMNAMDMSIVATLTSPISSSFNSFTLLSWLASAYIISNAALQPLCGKLTDIFGRRAGFVASCLVFATGNLICGLAKNEGTMIAGRVIGGIGGGGINAIATFVGSDLIPLRERGVWQGIGNLFFATGSGLGGVFGGWMNDTIGWRWAFLLQVPVILVSAVLAFFTVKIPIKETDKSRIERVDFLGSLALVTSVVLLLVGLNSAGNIVPWNHPLVYVSLPLAALVLVGFCYIENRVAPEPMIPVRLLLNRTVAAACLSNWFAAMAVFTIVYYIPIYFQILGSSSLDAGARLVPFSVGAALGSIGSGLIMKRTGTYRALNAATQALFVTGAGLIALTMHGRVAVWAPFFYLFICGIGYSSLLTITLIALVSAVDQTYQAVITSASYAFRSTGSTIGITVASAVFQNIVKKQLWKRFGARPGADKLIPRIRDSIDVIKQLPPEWKEGVIQVYMDALRGVWVTILGLAVVGAICSLFMRQHVLHSNLARK